MALAGGPADKFGNLYEGQWVVKCLLEVAASDSEYSHIHIEPPGEDGFEFCRVKNDIYEYHQVKTGEHWTISKFCKRPKGKKAEKKSVWDYFVEKLAEDERCECWMVTNNGFTELSDICKKVGDSESFDQFIASFLKKGLKTKFQKLGQISKLKDVDVYNRMMRVKPRNPDLASLTETVESLIRNIIVFEKSYEVSNAFDILFVFAFSNVHKKIDSEKIWRHLINRGFTLKASSEASSIGIRLQEKVELNLELESAIALEDSRNTTEAVAERVKTIYSILTKGETINARSETEKLLSECQEEAESILTACVLFIYSTIPEANLPREFQQIIWPINPVLVKRDDESQNILLKVESLLSELVLKDSKATGFRKIETWWLILLTIIPGRVETLKVQCKRVIEAGITNTIILTIAEIYGVEADFTNNILALEQELGLSEGGE